MWWQAALKTPQEHQWLTFYVTLYLAFYVFNFEQILHINLFQVSVVLHIETSYMICTENHMTGFCMKYNKNFRITKSGFKGTVMQII